MGTVGDVPQRAPRILVVDDEAGMRDFLDVLLKRAGWEVELAASGAQALSRLEERAPELDLVLTDLTMPGVDGMDVLKAALAIPGGPQVVMMTAFATTETAIEAMKAGALDYVLKPFKPDAIKVVLDKGLESRRIRRENEFLRRELRGVQELDHMIARSPEMKKIFELVRRLAEAPANVLIRGESGTGKELVARALHNLSSRPGEFVALNCGAIPSTLIESELFGHVKGAFTGASHERAGIFEVAQGGTLFLDEIGELPLAMQVKLLRALQERRIRRVGGHSEIEIDCRVVAATNRDLEAAVESGEFRQDLYFRLDVVQLSLPALRNRRDDIQPLAERFFERHNRQTGLRLSGITPDAMARLVGYDYPGNVRELENIMERAVTLETGGALSADQIPQPRSAAPDGGAGEPELRWESYDLEAELADLERRRLLSALDAAGGIRKRAAERLGITFRSLRYRLKKHGISNSDD